MNRDGGKGRRQANLRIRIAGFDGGTPALKALKEGAFDVTATRQRRWAAWGLEGAVALVKGDRTPADKLQPATLTAKDNVDGFIAYHPRISDPTGGAFPVLEPMASFLSQQPVPAGEKGFF